jgi:hypothetical protein
MKFRTQGPMTMSEAIELVRRYEKRGKIAYKELDMLDPTLVMVISQITPYHQDVRGVRIAPSWRF